MPGGLPQKGNLSRLSCSNLDLVCELPVLALAGIVQ